MKRKFFAKRIDHYLLIIYTLYHGILFLSIRSSLFVLSVHCLRHERLYYRFVKEQRCLGGNFVPFHSPNADVSMSVTFQFNSQLCSFIQKYSIVLQHRIDSFKHPFECQVGTHWCNPTNFHACRSHEFIESSRSRSIIGHVTCDIY